MLKAYLPLNWALIHFTGSDTTDFLQRLTTINLKTLSIGSGTQGCFLTPQGKIRSVFWLWRNKSDDYFFELDGGTNEQWKRELLATIDQFHFGEKFSLKELSDFKTCWLLGESPVKPIEEKNGMYYFNHGSGDLGSNWVSVWGQASGIGQTVSGAQLLDQVQMDRLRIQNLSPAVDHEITTNANPLEIGLSKAVSPGKGCYPGQEVIEKIVALGSPAKRMAAVVFEKAVTVGDSIRSGGSDVGTITSASGNHALAIVKKTHAKEDLQVQIEKNNETLTGTIKKVAPYA